MNAPILSLKNILFAFFIVISAGTFAQVGTIRGFVYLKDSGEPVLFTNVFLKGTTIGNATDVNGYFSITKIPAGNYTIIIPSSMGYDSLIETVTVTAGDILTKKLYLTKSNITLSSFGNCCLDKKLIHQKLSLFLFTISIN